MKANTHDLRKFIKLFLANTAVMLFGCPCFGNFLWNSNKYN